MKTFKTIKEIYQPVQPALKNVAGKISYTELQPIPELSNFIYCYWQLKTNTALSENFIYRVVTDGCMDIFWEAQNPQLNFITGFSNQYAEFPLMNQFNYFGIRFLPTAFPILFKTNASELTNRFEELDAVIPKLAKQLGDQCEGILDLPTIKSKLDDLFLQQINIPSIDFDNRMYSAIEIILKSKGVLSVESDLDVGISPRQLRRLFKFYIGDTPKVFCKVVRFQHLLKGKPSSKSLRENKLYYDLGYYDQTHFIKEFKHLYGTTPTKAF